MCRLFARSDPDGLYKRPPVVSRIPRGPPLIRLRPSAFPRPPSRPATCCLRGAEALRVIPFFTFSAFLSRFRAFFTLSAFFRVSAPFLRFRAFFTFSHLFHVFGLFSHFRTFFAFLHLFRVFAFWFFRFYVFAIR